jgi:hypothetical protein
LCGTFVERNHAAFEVLFEHLDEDLFQRSAPPSRGKNLWLAQLRELFVETDSAKPFGDTRSQRLVSRLATDCVPKDLDLLCRTAAVASAKLTLFLHVIVELGHAPMISR